MARLLRYALVMLVALGAAGCAMELSGPGDDGTGLRRAAMANGGIVVTSPGGYCIDPATLRDGFVMMAACQNLTDEIEGRTDEAALITLTLGGFADPDELPDPQAIATMADAPLLAQDTSDGLVSVHLGSGGDRVFPGSDPRYWRGAMIQGGRLLGLALYVPRDSALAEPDSAQAKRMLRRLMARITSDSPRMVTETIDAAPPAGGDGRGARQP